MLTVIKLALVSILLAFILSLGYAEAWRYYILIFSICVLAVLEYKKRSYEWTAKEVVDANPKLFYPAEEEMLLAAPGIFIPQMETLEYKKMELSATSGWVQLIAVIGIYISLLYKQLDVTLSLGLALLYSIYSKPAIYFYSGERKKDIQKVILLTYGMSKSEQLGLTQGRINSIDSAWEFSDYMERYDKICNKLSKLKKI